jgi:1-aminocyclopropane-1-carboxylate deaminase/D-cysteine desulfhydrase-like pyridoxal-dependent ACC family enzyme
MNMRRVIGILLLVGVFAGLLTFGALKAGWVVALAAFAAAIGLTAVLALAVWLIVD